MTGSCLFIMMFSSISVILTFFYFVCIIEAERKKPAVIGFIICGLCAVCLITWNKVAHSAVPCNTTRCEIQRNGDVKYTIFKGVVYNVDEMIDPKEWEVEWEWRDSVQSYGIWTVSNNNMRYVRKATAEKK